MSKLTVDEIMVLLEAKDWRVRHAAMTACQGRTDIPVSVIEQGLRDGDCDVRHAAMTACQGRTDIPVSVIEQGLRDGDWRVRHAAMDVCAERDVPFQPSRSFEPPKRVYKKCLGGVIVVAVIPKASHVRGARGKKCRASDARIVEIQNAIPGAEVGISLYDNTIAYRVGDVVHIDDFDFSNNECSQGFHFFCTKKEAVEYDL